MRRPALGLHEVKVAQEVESLKRFNALGIERRIDKYGLLINAYSIESSKRRK